MSGVRVKPIPVQDRERSVRLAVFEQGCSLGLERLDLETVWRRFLERLVSVLKV